MVACLSGLNRLEEFELGFRSPQIWRRHLPPSTRCVLPALSSLRFKGSCEYLEDLISPIDSPLLDNLDVIVHHLELDTPQLAEFVDRASKLKALREAHVIFGGLDMFVSLLTSMDTSQRALLSMDASQRAPLQNQTHA